MSKHIPGPWSCDRVHPDCDVTYIDGDSGEVAVVYCTDRPERKASAILIAAAPELLEALCELIEAAESMIGTCGCIRGKTPEDDDTHTHDAWAEDFLSQRLAAAQAAIKKARGEA